MPCKKNALIFLQVFLLPWLPLYYWGLLLSGVKDYSCFGYKTWSRPVVSGNIKDLFACRKMTETFISVNQQTVPFSNGPLEKPEEDRSQSTLPQLPSVWKKVHMVHVPCDHSFGCQGPPIIRKWSPNVSVICYTIRVSMCAVSHIKGIWILVATCNWHSF